MIYTSTELFNVFMEDTRQIMVRVKINGAVFDNDNISTLNLEYGSMDGANFSLGSTFASSLKITFAELVEGLAELDEIEVEMGAVLPDETIEYVKMGTFIINEEVMMDRNNNTTSIDAMDRMVMLGEIYEPTLEGDHARIIDIAVDIANQAGVVVSNDFDRLRTDSIQIPREKTLREAIGIIAQFEVGFATFNRDGELDIRRLNDPNFDISPEDYTLKGLVKNEVPFRLNGVQCQIGDSEEDVLQTGASTGTQIVLNNPSMTQAHLDRIYTELSTLNYYPFSLEWYGHPALEAGDWIEIEDLQGNKFKTPNLHYTLDFNGGLKAKSQAETTSSSEVVYQYKSPLKQEIQAIAARLSASGGNHVYDDLTPPTNPKEGDLWFKPEGPDTIILIYERLEDGSLDWVEKLNTGDTTKNADAIEKTLEEVEEAKQQAKLDAEQALADAKAHADAEVSRIDTALSTDIDGAIDLAEEAKQDAIDKANQALEDAKAHADAEVQASKEHFDSLIEDVETDVTNAQATADSAVEQIDTAVANAGFTSLDDTIQNMDYIATTAEQGAQQAITNASDAYGLAQTSISEAQTAQANSLTALGEAEDALDGVKDLDIRVDEVESELTMKADNTFMTEDGELITLSNAITFNAHRFSSDMSRIESRVESLAGEINLIILKGAFENRTIATGNTFPNPTTVAPGRDTMGELIEVTPDETLAFSKETVDGSNLFRIAYYDANYDFVSVFSDERNEFITTVPSGVKYMWVSYPHGSKPQAVRGSNILPYRPSLADQMTTSEMTIFRNEYDEFADKTERRLTAIDSSGGRLETAELLISQTANGLTLKADQTTVDELSGEIESLGTEFDVVAGQVSSRVWSSDIETAIDDIEIGGRNLVLNSDSSWIHVDGLTTWHRWVTGSIDVEPGETYTYSIDWKKGRWAVRLQYRAYDLDGEYIGEVWNEDTLYSVLQNGRNSFTFTLAENVSRIVLGFRIVDAGEVHSFDYRRPKLEKGNIATDWTPALEDTMSVINHIETEWTQTFEDFEFTVSDNQGKVNKQLQTLENSLSAINDPTTGRLTIAEQSLNGFRNEVYNADGSSKLTQLATGLSSFVGGVHDRKNRIPSWEIGGLYTADGAEYDTPDRIRSTLIEKNDDDGTYANYYLSLDGVPVNATYIMRYKADGEFLDTFRDTNTVGLTDIVPYARIVIIGDPVVLMQRKYQFEKGGVSEYVPFVGDVSQSQISQLADNINLRVSKGDVVNQINVSTEGILIDGKKTHITGTTTIDDGVIKNAHIANLNASKIDAGTINTARLNATEVVAQGLTANVIKSTHINTSTATIDKLFANETMINRLTTKTAFINSIKAVNIDAARITSGTIDAARIDAKFIVAEGLEVDVIEAKHISADTATIDKLFADEANIDVLTSKEAFINSIKAVEIDADKITSGKLDAGQITVVNLDVSSLSGNTAEFVTASFNGINSYTQIDADGIYMSGSGSWRRTYLTATGFDLYNGGNNKAGAIGYFKEHANSADSNENYMRTTEGGQHFVGIGVNRSHSFAVGYNEYTTTPNGFDRALVVSGISGNISLLRSTTMGNGVRLWFNGGSYIGEATDSQHFNINAKGQIRLYNSIDSLKVQIGANIDLYSDLNMNDNNIYNNSDVRLKKNITPTGLKSLDVIKQWNFVDYEWRDEKFKGTFMGVIAQDTPEIASYNEEAGFYAINSSKQLMMTTHALHELALNHDGVAQLAKTNESKIHKLQQELSKANRRIEELEGAI